MVFKSKKENIKNCKYSLILLTYFYFRSLFDFNIEKYINVGQFIDLTQLDVTKICDINTFIERNYVMKLDVIKESDDDLLRERWREKSL